MPFDELDTEPRELVVPSALISYMRSTKREGKAKVQGKTPPKPKLKINANKPQLTITLPTTICGTGKVAQHRFLLGTGDERGKARIKGCKPNDPKAVKPKEMAHSFTWKFGYVPALGEDIADQERVLARKISDDEFEIDLPEWWKTS